MKTVIPRSLTEKERLDPALAGGMSAFLPGVGQIYDGDAKRGVFFLVAGLFNYLVLLMLLFARPLLRFVEDIGSEYHMVLNPELSKVIYHMQFGSAASIVLFLLFIGFAAYAARDAYDKAVALHRQPLYADHIVGMPEATSGSYIFHASLLVAFFILAFFFLVPPPPKEQFTVIEFQATEESSTNHQKTTVKSNNDSKAGGKENPKFAGNKSAEPKSSHAKNESRSAPAAQAAPKQLAAAPPAAASRPEPAPAKAAAPQPVPHPMSQQNYMFSPAAVLPMPTTASSVQSVSQILPALPTNAAAAVPTPAVPRPMPTAMAAAPSRIAAPTVAAAAAQAPAPPRIAMAQPTTVAGIGAPSPVAVATATGDNSAISPVAIGGKSVGTEGSKPSPTKGRGTSGSIPNGATSGPNGNMQAPVVGMSRGSSASSPGENGVPMSQGSRSANNGDPQKGSGRGPGDFTKEVNWGPYMADLQRRIKRQWFPPKGPESRKVRVVFQVHRDGQMTNLRLLDSSGISISDQAAMKAVEAAAPFRPLPDDAPESVDIEFTFDYNVFNSGNNAKFRSF